MSRMRALITGLAGESLTPAERGFLRQARPAGIILFTRNCTSPDQIRALVASVREAIGEDDCLVLIDQEGGRVQRLRPPLARKLPPARAYAKLYEADRVTACRAAFDAARLVASELSALSINTNCAPVLDLPVAGSHDIIGDRAYGMAGAQVVPVIKHIPGHGRATADSHHDLPVVASQRAELSATDFVPFRMLAHLPAAMTAHVVYTAIDAAAPATTSAHVIGEVIRGEIGFGGLLMSDDLSMQALSGTIRARAEGSIAAGCDIALHCNGELAEMEAASSGVPELAGAALTRFNAAIAITLRSRPFDEAEALASLALAMEASQTGRESV